MKDNYKKPITVIEEFNTVDIVTTSGIENNNGDDF